MLNLFILGLATWRLSSLFVNEAGPFDIFIKIRELTGIKHDKTGDPYMIPGNFFAGVLSCVWCCSVWMGIIVTVLFEISPLALVFFYPLAISAIAVIIQTQVHKEV